MGTVNGVDVGRVTIKGHPNYGREYVGVDWDADEKCPWGDRSRPFVDELVIVSSAEASTDEASTDEASTDEVTEAARHGETVKLHRELCGDQPKRKTPDLRQLANPEKADPEAVAEIHASRCPECKGAGCPQCGYKGTPRTVCPKHHVVDKRGGRSIELGAIPACEPITYGAWSEGAGGFVYTGDCATEVANWAADELRQLAKEDDTDKFEILAICPDHEEQPKHSCQECNAEAAEHEETDEAEAPTRFLVDPHTWLRRSY
jgi:hypothetical protein